MRAFVILLVAMTLGLGAGYAWSSLSAPAAHASARSRRAMIAIPPSPEEQPEALDGEWAARAADRPAPAPVRAQGDTTPAETVSKAGCNEASAGDGVACEPYRGGPRS